MLSALDPFERLAELQREIDRDQTTDFLIDELVSVSTIACVGWSPTALEALVQRGDCAALIIDSFGSVIVP
jgi:hypothetical protein